MTFRVVKPLVAFIFISLMGALIFLPVIGVLAGNLWFTILFLLIWLASLWTAVDLCIFRWIIISEKGIVYKELSKHYEFSWDDLKTIGIGYVPMKRLGSIPWLYFTTEEFSCPILHGRKMTSDFIMVHYRKKILAEIKKYRKNDIADIHFISGKRK